MYRLKKQDDIRMVLRKGRRIDSPFFSVVFRKNGLTRLRFTSVASRLVDKRATERNRLRRRVREWVRTRSGTLGKPLDTVFIFKKDAVSAQRKNFYEELERVFKKIGESTS